MNQNNIAIQIRNLSKIYKLYNRHIDRLKEAVHPQKKMYHRPFYALRNINLEVRRGEIIGIVGRNGAGKSTLAKIISGVIAHTQGQCNINGKISSLLGLSSGFNPELTGIENIYLNGVIRGFSKKQMDSRIEGIVSFAEIGDFIHQPIKNYSSGMNARLNFAMAIDMKPEILVLDEVLSVGDELFKRKCYARMEKLFNSGCTILFISHSLGTINEICSRAILIDKGELLLEGPPKFVTSHYQKYLFTENKISSGIRQDIIQLNQKDREKSKFTSKFQNIPNSKLKNTMKTEAYFLPDLKSKTRVITKNSNVEIFDILIKTKDGKKVNVLFMNQDYVYSFKVKFDIDARDVGFGTPIKSQTGLIITNHTINENYIKKVSIGTILEMECHFKCLMYPGLYYTNASVGAKMNGKRVILNRIVDALVFKVQSTGKEGKNHGLVYCHQYFNIKKL